MGFAIESSLERMIEWLSDNYAVNVNAVVLSYVKTKSGDELLTKTSIISEEMEQERRRKKKFEVHNLDDRLAYITDAAVRSRVTALLEEIKNWKPGSISVDAIKYAISVKVNNHVFAYLHPRRQFFLDQHL